MPLSLLPTRRRTRPRTRQLVEKGGKDAYPQASKRQQVVSATLINAGASHPRSTQFLGETEGN